MAKDGVALAGWVLACVLGGFVYAEAMATRSVFHRYQNDDESARRANRYCGTDSPVPLRNPATPGNKKGDGYSEKDKDDLCQQWRMAEAAEDAAIAAWLQLPLSMIGLGFVGLATFWAARSARSAADAAIAAERAVEISARIEGARLFVDQPIAPLPPHRVVQLDIYNLGKSPAALVEWFGFATDMPLPVPPSYGTGEDVRGTIIQGGARYSRSMQLPPRSGTHSCFIACSILYDDVLGRRRRMGFAFEIEPATARTRRTGGDAYSYDREEDA